MNVMGFLSLLHLPVLSKPNRIDPNCPVRKRGVANEPDTSKRTGPKTSKFLIGDCK
jgi:hypothetical protein